MKINLLKFLSITAVIFSALVFYAGSAYAGDCAYDGEGNWIGTCDFSCSAGYKENTTGSAECSENWFDKTCCVPDTTYGEVLESDTCAGGRGECQAGWCSSGMIEDANNNFDCSGNMFQTTCCVPESSGGGSGTSGTGTTTGTTEGIPIDGTKITIPDVGLPDPGKDAEPGKSGIEIILLNFLNWLLIIFLIASLIAFVITGIMYLLAMGDSRSALMERAKNYFFYAIIALFITGSGLIIVNIVNEFLQGKL